MDKQIKISKRTFNQWIIIVIVTILLVINSSCNIQIEDDNNWITIKEPTCIKAGEEKRINEFGEEEIRIISPTGHRFSTWQLVKKATCDTAGELYRVCTCGEKEIKAIKPIGHDYQLTTIKPTCESDGYDLHHCLNCHDEYKDQFISCYGHDYTSTILNPTCEADGFTTYTCLRCNHTYNDHFITKLGHSFNNWEVITNPTCESKGYKKRTCNCGKEEIEELLPLNHTYSSVEIKPTCESDGYTLFTCSLCNHSYKDHYINKLNHQYSEYTYTFSETSSSKGIETSVCSICQHEKVREYSGNLITSGDLGYNAGVISDKIKYNIYDDGTMYVVGTGYTYGCNWNGEKQPYIDYRQNVKKIIIGEGITRLNGGVFAYFTELLEVVYPSTLKYIANNAFMCSFATSVTELRIPKNVEFIGSYAYGVHSKVGTFFKTIIIENPSITFPNKTTVSYDSGSKYSSLPFNSSERLNEVRFFGYGDNHQLEEYVNDIGGNYYDLDNYKEGENEELTYNFYKGQLEIIGNTNTDITLDNQIWLENGIDKSVVTKLVINKINRIEDLAFYNYINLEEVVLSSDLSYIGLDTFSVPVNSNTKTLNINIPKRTTIEGTQIFSNRSLVNLTTSYFSFAANINESNVNKKIIKDIKILLIGNSYSEDASNCGQGMTTSKLYDIIKSMLGKDSSVTIGLCYSGGKSVAWHASKAEIEASSYSLRVIGDELATNTWLSLGSVSSKKALQYYDWDYVTLQPYGSEVTTGIASYYPTNLENENPNFLPLSVSLPYMLDYVHTYAKNAQIYAYLTWGSSSDYSKLNTGLKAYNNMVKIAEEYMNYKGPTTDVKFSGIIPVGCAIQNARSTYLGLLNYINPEHTDESVSLINDIQKGLQRDGGHLSFYIGRYIASKTFAEVLITSELREKNYVLPVIGPSLAVGTLPVEYTTIANKCVDVAINSLNNNSLASSIINGYEVNHIDILMEEISKLDYTFSLSDNDEIEALIKQKITMESSITSEYKDLKVDLPTDYKNLINDNTYTTVLARLTIQLGYAIRTIDINVNIIKDTN